MADRFKFDVFLSHHWKDEPRVWVLAEELRATGLRVAIERGLKEARAQVLCLSPAALASDWVTFERSTLLFRDPSNAGRRFILLLLADCEIPDALRRYKYVDYRRKTREAFDELLAACRSEVTSAPPVPEAKPAKEPAQSPEQVEPLAVQERRLTGHTDWVKSVAFNPDGTWVASGSKDKTVRIWNLKTGACRTTLQRHMDNVNAVAVTPDGMRVLSASDDQSVGVWDVTSGRELKKLVGHRDAVWSVIALHNNSEALSGGWG